MDNTKPVSALVLAAALSLFSTTCASAAVVADGTPFNPGVPLTGTANFGGTVVASKTVNFAESITPTFTGSLRSVVVQNGGGTLDFYYQITNIATAFPPADIFRIVIDGFDPFATGVMDFSTNGLAGIAGAPAFVIGNKSPRTADRDPAIGSGIGFGFASNPGAPLFNPNNLSVGDTSFWMIARSNATQFVDANATISGFGTALTSAFAPTAGTPGGPGVVPLPAALLPGALAGLGIMIRSSRRRLAHR